MNLLIKPQLLKFPFKYKIVVPGRLELPTPTLSVLYSNQLSYETLFLNLFVLFELTAESKTYLYRHSIVIIL